MNSDEVLPGRSPPQDSAPSTVTPGQGFQTGEAWAYREIIDTLLASEDMMMTSNG